MNVGDYSLEKFAKGYLHDRSLDAVGLHALALTRCRRRAGTGRPRFVLLVGWWLRITALLIRYPVDPVRVTAKLATIGLPAILVGGLRNGGGGHVGR